MCFEAEPPFVYAFESSKGHHGREYDEKKKAKGKKNKKKQDCDLFIKLIHETVQFTNILTLVDSMQIKLVLILFFGSLFKLSLCGKEEEVIIIGGQGMSGGGGGNGSPMVITGGGGKKGGKGTIIIMAPGGSRGGGGGGGQSYGGGGYGGGPSYSGGLSYGGGYGGGGDHSGGYMDGSGSDGSYEMMNMPPAPNYHPMTMSMGRPPMSMGYGMQMGKGESLAESSPYDVMTTKQFMKMMGKKRKKGKKKKKSKNRVARPTTSPMSKMAPPQMYEMPMRMPPPQMYMNQMPPMPQQMPAMYQNVHQQMAEMQQMYPPAPKAPQHMEEYQMAAPQPAMPAYGPVPAPAPAQPVYPPPPQINMPAPQINFPPFPPIVVRVPTPIIHVPTPIVNVPPAIVNITPPKIHVPPAIVNVPQPQINFPPISMPTPIINMPRSISIKKEAKLNYDEAPKQAPAPKTTPAPQRYQIQSPIPSAPAPTSMPQYKIPCPPPTPAVAGNQYQFSMDNTGHMNSVTYGSKQAAVDMPATNGGSYGVQMSNQQNNANSYDGASQPPTPTMMNMGQLTAMMNSAGYAGGSNEKIEYESASDSMKMDSRMVTMQQLAAFMNSIEKLKQFQETTKSGIMVDDQKEPTMIYERARRPGERKKQKKQRITNYSSDDEEDDEFSSPTGFPLSKEYRDDLNPDSISYEETNQSKDYSASLESDDELVYQDQTQMPVYMHPTGFNQSYINVDVEMVKNDDESYHENNNNSQQQEVSQESNKNQRQR